MPKIEIKGVTKYFVEKKSEVGTVALYKLNAIIPSDKFTVVLGKSGSGKTTLLRALVGLITPEEGEIFFDGKEVTSLPPAKRNVSYISQEYALYPHKTVFDNVAYPLTVAKVPYDEIRRRVNEILETLEISLLSSRRVRALSGGQQQKVALARALVKNPSAVFLDEPLSNLDEPSREKTVEELSKIRKLFNTTFVYVTHNPKEAFLLADYVLVMDNGEVVQEGFSKEVFADLQGPFMRDFAPFSGFDFK